MSGRVQYGRGRGVRRVSGGISSSSSRMDGVSPPQQSFEFRPRHPGQSSLRPPQPPQPASSSFPSSVPETQQAQFPDAAQFYSDPLGGHDDTEPYYNLEELLAEHYTPPPGEEEEDLELPMTFQELLSQPSRADHLIVLDPDNRTPGSKWLGRNDSGSRIVRCFSNLMKNSFRKPYYSWKWVSHARREKWLYEFAQTYHWNYSQHARVRREIFAKAAVRLGDLVSKARRARKQPPWIGKDLWTSMCQYWDTDENKAKSQAASNSRLNPRDGLGPPRHVGGSKAFSQHGEDMEVDLGRRATPSEVFLKTHTKGGEFIDGRAKKIQDDFQRNKQARLEELDTELASDGRTQVQLTQEQEEEVFLQTCPTLRDGRYYGLGNLHRKSPGPLEGSSSRPAWSAMQEELQKSQDEIAALRSSKEQHEQTIAELKRKVEAVEAVSARPPDEDVIAAFIRADPRFQQFAASFRGSSSGASGGSTNDQDPPPE